MHFKLSPSKFLLVLVLLIFIFSCKPGEQAIDEEYTSLIKQATTRPEFQSPWTSYLPEADGIPTPLDVLGHISGASGKLIYYDDAVKYLNALADATPNPKSAV